MKKFYFFTLCSLLTVPAVASPRFHKSQRPTLPLMETVHRLSAPARAQGSGVWRPASQTDYMYEEGEWMELGTTCFTYDTAGNPLVELTQDIDDMQFKIERTFDSYGYVTSMLQTLDEGDGWENEGKRTYVYDPVVHSYFTERMGYDWDNGQWVQNYLCERNVITRNSGGAITEIVKQLPLFNQMLDAYRSVWTYGNADATRATGFKYYVTNGEQDAWQLDNGLDYRDIVWKNTDGEMTASSFYDLVEGDNRVESVTIYGDDVLDGYFLVTYTDRPGEYLIKETYANREEVGRTIQKTFIDDNGSFTVTTTEYFDEEGNLTAEPTYADVLKNVFDDRGNLVLESISDITDGEEMVMEAAKYEYTYDAHSNITEMIMSTYDPDTEEYTPENRIVYSEYSEISGIDGIEASDDTAPRYYNLQGIEVKSPQPGQLLIKRTAAKAEKTIIR